MWNHTSMPYSTEAWDWLYSYLCTPNANKLLLNCFKMLLCTNSDFWNYALINSFINKCCFFFLFPLPSVLICYDLIDILWEAERAVLGPTKIECKIWCLFLWTYSCSAKIKWPHSFTYLNNWLCGQVAELHHTTVWIISYFYHSIKFWWG
jgi:hypothetical protein